MQAITQTVNRKVMAVRNRVHGWDLSGCGEHYGDMVLTSELIPLCPFFTSGAQFPKPVKVTTFSKYDGEDVPF